MPAQVSFGQKFGGRETPVSDGLVQLPDSIHTAPWDDRFKVSKNIRPNSAKRSLFGQPKCDP
jgi:hypothetical protein